MAEKEGEQDEGIDELQQYVFESRLKRTGPVILWWIEKAQRIQFPLLFVMAIDIFSIPAMSFEAGRVFLWHKTYYM